jgi:hypothetical protein
MKIRCNDICRECSRPCFSLSLATAPERSTPDNKNERPALMETKNVKCIWELHPDDN